MAFHAHFADLGVLDPATGEIMPYPRLVKPTQ
jgi:hypothetical protein